MGKYYSADITWCDCGCKNTKCEYHIRNHDPMKRPGPYSIADRSEGCPNYRGRNTKEEADGS